MSLVLSVCQTNSHMLTSTPVKIGTLYRNLEDVSFLWCHRLMVPIMLMLMIMTVMIFQSNH